MKMPLELKLMLNQLLFYFEFDNSQKEYIKSLPFHHSQEIIEEKKKHF